MKKESVLREGKIIGRAAFLNNLYKGNVKLVMLLVSFLP